MSANIQSVSKHLLFLKPLLDTTNYSRIHIFWLIKIHVKKSSGWLFIKPLYKITISASYCCLFLLLQCLSQWYIDQSRKPNSTKDIADLQKCNYKRFNKILNSRLRSMTKCITFLIKYQAGQCCQLLLHHLFKFSFWTKIFKSLWKINLLPLDGLFYLFHVLLLVLPLLTISRIYF